MEIKLFGKSLFEAKKSKADIFWGQATSANKDSKFLVDFYGSLNGSVFSDSSLLMEVTSISNNTQTALEGKNKKKEDKPKETITPKSVYEMKMLNDLTFRLNTDSIYIEKQLADFKEKLTLIKSEERDMSRGVNEISSIISRMENRKKYPEFKEFFENYPYTTTTKINEVIKEHGHLKLGQIAQFIADLPNEAITAMKDYNKNTDKICGKQAVFYIIADQKDFKSTNTRRDPILLAQSPFGHFWQVIGAWDREMIFVEEL